MELARVLAAVALGLRLCLLPLRRLLRLGLGCLALRLVQLGGGHENRQGHELFLPSLVTRREEYLGVVVRICVSRNFAKLQRVLIAVVGHDMHVGCAVRHLGLDGDEPAGDVPAIEYPARRIASEDRRNLLLSGQQE